MHLLLSSTGPKVRLQCVLVSLYQLATVTKHARNHSEETPQVSLECGDINERGQ